MVLLTSTINMMFLRRRQHSSHKKIQDEANDVQIGIDIGEGRGENIYIYIYQDHELERKKTDDSTQGNTHSSGPQGARGGVSAEPK